MLTQATPKHYSTRSGIRPLPLQTCLTWTVVACVSVCFLTESFTTVHGETTEAVLGVPASKQDLYKQDPFTCPRSQETIQASRINDDFCDCKDGTDEPGTSACPNGQFYCINKGFRGKYIPSSQVGDGICDCCDGSDEINGPRECENTCEEDGAQWRDEQAKKIKLVEQGARKRQKYVEEASAALSKVEYEVSSLKRELEGVNSHLERLEKTKEEAEAREQQERENFSLNVHERVAEKTGLDKMDANQLRQLIIDFVTKHGQQEEFTETLQERARKAAEEKGEDGQAAEDAIEFPDEANLDEFETDEAKSAREAVESMEKKRKEIEEKIEKEENKHTNDYGPDNVFYQLDGVCLEAKILQYNYKICPYGDARQDNTKLGKFDGFAENYTVMNFDNGANCFNGPKRSLRVEMECGTENEIKNVIEPEKCVYLATMTTPAVCDETFAREIELDIEGMPSK